MLTWIADALRAEGCRVSEQSGWKSRGRPGAFAPFGVLWHHTGTTTSSSNTHPTLNTCINGRPDLAGPLCQVMIGYDGICYVIAAGRANHGGASNGFGPFTSSRDQNDQSCGFEIDYDGTQKMSAAQQDAATRCSAAFLKRFKRDEDYAARHEETSTTGKWDTGGLSGDKIRSLIRDYLAGATGEWDEMASKQEVTDAVLYADVIPQPERTSGDYWTLVTYVDNMGEWVLTCRDLLQAQAAQLDEMQRQLDALTNT